jgi:hypothetical protein
VTMRWRTWGLAVAGLTVVSVILHLIWLERFRHGYLTEWDEAGYMQIAVLDRAGLSHGGLDGLVRAVVTQPAEAPLVPLVTVPVYLVAGTGVYQGLFVVPVFFVGLVLATYQLARSIVGGSWAFLAALTVASLPAVVDYTRLYHFSVPAAACATAGLAALLRSDGLRRRGWAIAGGAFVGLMLLARTMTIAFLPGFALAVVVELLYARGVARRQMINLVLAILTAALVASSWYGRNAGSVRSYLEEAGYGAKSGTFGEEHPVTSAAFWTKELALIVQQLYVPLALILAGCLIAGVLAALRSRRVRSWSMTPRHAGALTLTAFVLEGYLALTSSANEGTAFALPWLPALVVLAVTGVAAVRSVPIRASLVGLLVAVALFNITMKSGFVEVTARPHTVHLRLLGDLPVTDGRGIVQRMVVSAGYPIGSPTEPLPPMHRKWTPLAFRVTNFILERSRRRHEDPEVLMAMDDELFNNTRLRLAAAISSGRYLAVGRLTPKAGGDRVADYAATLRTATANALVLAPRQRGIEKTLTPAKVEKAGRLAGFYFVRRFMLPDGRPLSIWWRDTNLQAGHARQ